MKLCKDTRDHISLPVHCKQCKKPASVEGRVGFKVIICEICERREQLEDILFR